MTASIDTVVFDLGQVLIDWDSRYLYRRIFDGDEKKVEWFHSEICTAEWNHAQDAGRSYAEAESLLIQKHPDVNPDWIRAWRVHFDETMRGEISGSVALLSQLKNAGIHVHALTNWPKETFPIARQRFGFLDWFETITVSSEEGFAKPDRRIFEVMAQKHGLNPRSTVFIDDKKTNVVAARELGFTGLLFTTPQILAQDLAQLIPLPPLACKGASCDHTYPC